ncbi:EthD family reductase [Leifsonia sp. L25]|uniref:EthD family reductase n=1 Tax=Actinomycetes TaxID=1760 RepID=UPI003D68399B
MTILYRRPTDPEAFRRYYEESHIPIARRMSGLTGWNLSWIDDDGPYVLVAELYAESKQSLDAVLSSPEGQAANADLANFVTGGVEFLTGPEVQVALA